MCVIAMLELSCVCCGTGHDILPLGSHPWRWLVCLLVILCNRDHGLFQFGVLSAHSAGLLMESERFRWPGVSHYCYRDSVSSSLRQRVRMAGTPEGGTASESHVVWCWLSRPDAPVCIQVGPKPRLHPGFLWGWPAFSCPWKSCVGQGSRGVCSLKAESLKKAEK